MIIIEVYDNDAEKPKKKQTTKYVYHVKRYYGNRNHLLETQSSPKSFTMIAVGIDNLENLTTNMFRQIM